MVLKNLEDIGNAVVARFNSIDKIAVELLCFAASAIVVFRLISPVVSGLGADLHQLLLGVSRSANMVNKAEVLSSRVHQGLTEFTQTGQQSKQGFLNSPQPDFSSISGQHESELRRANTRYLNSSASAENMKGDKVREFASDRMGYRPSLSGGIQYAVPEGKLPSMAAGF
jgi:hypothetical protein